MDFESLPPALEERVDRYASERHLNRDEALVALVESGLQHEVPSAAQPNSIAPEVRDWLRKLPEIQEQSRKELDALHRVNPSVEKLFGILEHEPETVEAIREAARERRRAMYGP